MKTQMDCLCCAWSKMLNYDYRPLNTRTKVELVSCTGFVTAQQQPQPQQQNNNNWGRDRQLFWGLVM